LIGGRRIQTTPQEETRIQLSAMNAEAAVRRYKSAIQTGSHDPASMTAPKVKSVTMSV